MRILTILGIAIILHAGSYDDYVAMLSNDPGIKKLEYQQHALTLDARQSGALDDPQLVIGIDNMPVEDPAFDRYLPTAKVIGFNQKFSSGREEAARVKLARSSTRSLQRDYLLSRLEAQLYIALAMYRLKRLQLNNLEAQREVLTAMQEEVNNQIYSGADMSVELSRIDERLLDITSRELVLTAEQKRVGNVLVRLVGEVPDVELPERTMKSWREALLYPVVIAKSDEKRALAQSSLAEARDDVDVSLQVLYKQREAGATYDGEDWVSVRGVVTLPLWGKGEAAYESALQQQRAATEDTQSTVREWRQKLADLDVEHEQTVKRIELKQKRLEAIAKTVRAQEDRYDVGHGRYIDVLESKLRLLDVTFQLKELETGLMTIAASQNSHIME
jgi:outer membrane protein TolC